MRLNVYTTLFFLSISIALNAQIDPIWVNLYDDGYVDTVFQGEGIIALSNGNYAVAAQANLPGEIQFSPAVYLLDSTRQLLATFIADVNGSASSVRIAEGTAGTIWVAARTDYAESDLIGTRIIHLTSDLSEVVQDEVIDFGNGLEAPMGINSIDDQIFILVRELQFNDSLLSNQSTYQFYALDPATLEVVKSAEKVFPDGSFSSTRETQILSITDSSIAMSIRTDLDTTVGADVYMIRELSTSDLSILEEITIRGIGRESYSLDFEYVSFLDAYAVTKRSSEVLFIHRNFDMLDIDTVALPEGASGFNFRSRLSLRGSSLFVMGQMAYSIEFSGGMIDTILHYAGYDNFSAYKDVSTDGKLIATVEGQTNALGGRIFWLATIDTIALEPTFLSTARGFLDVTGYWGAFPLPTSDSALYLALKQSGRVVDNTTTWGFELLDPEAGESTDQFVTTNDIIFWNEGDFDPEISPLVKTQDGYMAYINEGLRMTFFKFDNELNALDPLEIGFAAAEFTPTPFLLGDRLTETAATSYGIAGTTMGSATINDEFVYSPYVFACDTNFQVRIAARLETFSYYPFDRLSLAVNAQDELFTVGTKSQEADPFSTSDTIIVTKHDVDGSILFVSGFTLTDNTFQRVSKIDLSPDESELLISGTFFTENRIGFMVRINTEDGSIVGSASIPAVALGYGDGADISEHYAQYDANANLLLAVSVLDPENLSSQSDVGIIQLDTSLNVLGVANALTGKRPFADIQRFERYGDNAYLSGSVRSISGFDREGYIANISTSTLVNAVEVGNLSSVIEFTAAPNPTTGPVQISWINDQIGDYTITLYNDLGQIAQTWSGTSIPGPFSHAINIENVPIGRYFIKLELEDGFAIKSIIKK